MADADDYADVHDALGLLPTDPERFKPLGELSAYSPTLPERVKGGIQDLLMSGGAQAYPAGHIAGGISDLLGYLPPVAAAYAGDAMQHANSFGSAALASLGALPASKPAGIAVKTMEDLIPGYLGSAIGKMTPSEYMDSVGGVSKFAKAFPKTFRMLQPDLEDQLTASKAFQAAKTEQSANADPLAPEKLKQVYENAWKNGEAPFTTTADHVQKQDPGQFVYNIVGDAATAHGPWYQEMLNKYGNWATLSPSGDLSDEAISAKLAKNPGASIADIAGLAGPSSKFTTGLNKANLDVASFPREIPFDVPERAKALGFTQPALHGTQDIINWKGPLDQLKLPDAQLGVHFGNPKQAAHFSTRYGGLSDWAAPRTYPAVLQMQNPLEMKDMGSWYPDDIKTALHQINDGDHTSYIAGNGKRVISPEAKGQFPENELDELSSIKDVRDYLTSKGYDSVKYINAVEDMGQPSYIMFQESPTHEGYITGARSPFARFDPKQLHLPSLAAGGAGLMLYPFRRDEDRQ